MSTRLVYFFLFYFLRLRKRPTEEQEDNTRNEVFYFYKREYKLIPSYICNSHYAWDQNESRVTKAEQWLKSMEVGRKEIGLLGMREFEHR